MASCQHPIERLYRGDVPTVFAHACKLGLEGIVSKRLTDVAVRPIGSSRRIRLARR